MQQTQKDRVAELERKQEDGTITPTEKGTLRALSGGDPDKRRSEALERGRQRAHDEARVPPGGYYEQAETESRDPDLGAYRGED
jgi:hypothetical protein